MMPTTAPNVGAALGERLALGRRVSLLVLRSLNLKQLEQLERAMSRRGKRLPYELLSELKREARRQLLR
jgi:hypothetical protein